MSSDYKRLLQSTHIPVAICKATDSFSDILTATGFDSKSLNRKLIGSLSAELDFLIA